MAIKTIEVFSVLGSARSMAICNTSTTQQYEAFTNLIGVASSLIDERRKYVTMLFVGLVNAARTVKNANISGSNTLQLRCEMRYSNRVDVDNITSLIADQLAGRYLDSGHDGHSFVFVKRIKKPTIVALGSIEVTILYKVDGE